MPLSDEIWLKFGLRGRATNHSVRLSEIVATEILSGNLWQNVIAVAGKMLPNGHNVYKRFRNQCGVNVLDAFVNDGGSCTHPKIIAGWHSICLVAFGNVRPNRLAKRSGIALTSMIGDTENNQDLL
jgi:hypothetical protein